MAMKQRQKKDATGTSKAKNQLLLIDVTETEAGVNWLNSLTEPEVRDRILVEMFRKMQAEGVIEGFENIHGRNDKGVDFLIALSSAFGRTISGIQVKSKPITRSESAGNLSSIRIREECHSAMLHDFHFQGRNVRLDTIELWCSAPITDDAEKEMNPPHTLLRVTVKKDREILSLIERFCPALVNKVPQLAVTRYISQAKNPGSKSMRLLGCNLNPSSHFIEPFFSSIAPTSLKLVKNRNGTLVKKQDKLTVNQLVAEKSHSVVFSPPLSGRSYLLEHLKCRFADIGQLPVLLKPEDLPKGEFKIESVIAQHLGFLTPKQVADLQGKAHLVVLIDDVDKLSTETRERLFSLPAAGVRIIGTARRAVLPNGVKEFHVVGVDWLNIVRFLRSLDNKLAAGKPFVDRARNFINRAFESSGLPKNPFTIAVMLEECQHSTTRFSTPTMGRLIGRFIELQLGSHVDSGFLVDFETKREFLTRLAGHSCGSFSIHDFERILGKHIDAKGHPHSITDFSNDLLRSGVFERHEDTIHWSHPVIKEFFWVKNLITKKKLGPIIERLQKDLDLTLAALVGSQLEDGGPILAELLPRLGKIKLPSVNELVDSPEFATSLSKVITDKDQEELLTDIENEKLFQENDSAEASSNTEPKKDQQGRTLSSEERVALKQKLEPLFQTVADSQLHIAFNSAAVLLNARDTSRDMKEKTVDAVINCGELLGDFTQRVIVAFDSSNKSEFVATWLRIVLTCSFVEEMLGDPNLVVVFRRRLKASSSRTKTIALLDLLLCCGEEEYELVLAELQKAAHLGITFAFYWRVAMLYFFRFHRDTDRAALRKLLSDIRKLERNKLPRLL